MTSSPSRDNELRLLAQALFEELRTTSFDGVGVTRDSYGPGETRAMEALARVARAEGLNTRYDGAANLVIELEGDEPGRPVVACGSHLDSVPEGGNYDGAAGVIGGLVAMVGFQRQGIKPPRTIRLYGLRGEESAWFGQAYLGSRALFGASGPSDLQLTHRETGRSLEEHMHAAGACVDSIRDAKALLDASDLACYLELHIEQGPIMVARKFPVGVVTGIRGNYRHPVVTCVGEAAHSGAVPRWLRRDAVFAVSEFIMRLDRHWQALLEQGHDLVVTVGIVTTNHAEHAMSRVPGFVQFAVEFRSESAELLSDFEELLTAEASGIERLRGVRFELGEPRRTAPATMAPALCDALSQICTERNIVHERLPSGAGHDAAVFANQGVPSAMIFVRNEHGSHNPHEAMEMDDFFLGVDVLSDALLKAPELYP